MIRKAKIQISYDAEKLAAIEDYAAKKGVDLMAEEIRQQKETKARIKSEEKRELSGSVPIPGGPKERIRPRQSERASLWGYRGVCANVRPVSRL